METEKLNLRILLAPPPSAHLLFLQMNKLLGKVLENKLLLC
jgi:hypothetical protein